VDNVVNLNMSGKYKIQVTDRNGNLKYDLDWFDNLITNQGLNRIADQGNNVNQCSVGFGTTLPNVNDVGLTLPTNVFVIQAIEAEIGAVSVAPYYSWTRRKYVFTANTVLGNLSEVSIGWSNDNFSAFSHALITEDNVPITITIIEYDILTVYYELRIYPVATDVNSIVAISGVNYDVMTRSSRVGSQQWAGYFFGQHAVASSGIIMATYFGYPGTIFSTPSGEILEGGATSIAITPYTQDTFYVDISAFFSPEKANNPVGVRTVTLGFLTSGFGEYQFQFEPPIPKTVDYTLTLNFRIAWSRYTP